MQYCSCSVLSCTRQVHLIILSCLPNRHLGSYERRVSHWFRGNRHPTSWTLLRSSTTAIWVHRKSPSQAVQDAWPWISCWSWFKEDLLSTLDRYRGWRTRQSSAVTTEVADSAVLTKLSLGLRWRMMFSAQQIVADSDRSFVLRPE